MPRRLEWIGSPKFQGFGCSACNWKFKPSGPLVGDSLEEMKRKCEAERDQQFAAHVCVGKPVPKGPKIAQETKATNEIGEIESEIQAALEVLKTEKDRVKRRGLLIAIRMLIAALEKRVG